MRRGPPVRLTAVAAGAALFTILTATAAQSPGGLGSLTAMFDRRSAGRALQRRPAAGGAGAADADRIPANGHRGQRAGACGSTQPAAGLEAAEQRPSTQQLGPGSVTAGRHVNAGGRGPGVPAPDAREPRLIPTPARPRPGLPSGTPRRHRRPLRLRRRPRHRRRHRTPRPPTQRIRRRRTRPRSAEPARRTTPAPDPDHRPPVPDPAATDTPAPRRRHPPESPSPAPHRSGSGTCPDARSGRRHTRPAARTAKPTPDPTTVSGGVTPWTTDSHHAGDGTDRRTPATPPAHGPAASGRERRSPGTAAGLVGGLRPARTAAARNWSARSADGEVESLDALVARAESSGLLSPTAQWWEPPSTPC